jgi:hypothetical protein
MTVSIDGLNGVVFSDLSTQNTSAFTGGFAYRNRIINGAMVIDQRNNGAAQTITSSSPYSLDRWQAYSGGANTTLQQVASGVSGVPFVMQITGAASNTALQIQQKIESKNIADCAGSTVTLSALISNSLLTTVTWVAYYANATDNFSSTTSIATGTFTVNATLTQYSVQIALPANAANGVGIQFATGAQTSGTFKLTNVQLEKGSTATSFDYRDYGRELIMCQRYYYRTTTFEGLVTSRITNSTLFMTSVFPVSMRTAPTALEQNGSLAAYNILVANTGTAVTSVPSFGSASLVLGTTMLTATSGHVSGQSGFTYGSGYLGWSAEL